MKNVELSESQFQIIKDLLNYDIEDIANSPDLFEDGEYNAKEYIDKRIELCRVFNIDFWNSADLSCSHYVFERLKALYEGQTTREFTENYETPSQSELGRRFLRAFVKGGENPALRGL